MAIRSVIYPEFEVVRYDRCTRCGRCIKECANGVHFFSQDKKMVLSDDTSAWTVSGASHSARSMLLRL